MMNRENVLRELLAEYENQRALNRREEIRRREEVARRSQAAGALIARREEVFYARMRAAFAQPREAQRLADGLQSELERINAALRAELVRLGLPEDYLQPVYRCPICRDTGYVGEPVHEQCACLRQRMLQRLYREEGLAGLERENFAAFDAGVFPDEPLPGQEVTQRAYMERVRALCERYADEYPRAPERNLLFFGATGLGKTFLMNCIAQRVLERGMTVLRVTAYRLVEVMRAQRWDERSAQTARALCTCDLLALDDLGAEPMLENVTIEALYHVLSERIAAERGFVISTNLSLSDLQAAYTERVSSRLLDTRRTRAIRFLGRDVRLAGGR